MSHLLTCGKPKGAKVYFEFNRFKQNVLMSCRVLPCAIKSATISPTTGQNLNPCPEQGETINTCACLGWRSMRKCSSGVLVYIHVTARRHRPLSAGRTAETERRASAIS